MQQPKQTCRQIAIELADLLDGKIEGYGDSLNVTAEVMKQLYPQGVMPDNYKYFGILYRMMDKVCRIANGHHEDSWLDIAGYALRVEQQRRDALNSEIWIAEDGPGGFTYKRISNTEA
jgi:hypothetical protein